MKGFEEEDVEDMEKEKSCFDGGWRARRAFGFSEESGELIQGP